MPYRPERIKKNRYLGNEMKNSIIDVLLVEKILENIPKNIKAVDYLMDVLGMSRNAVYRRLRYEKSFSLEEIIKLSSTMGFSLDDVVSVTYSGSQVDSYYKQDGKITASSSITSLFKHFGVLLNNSKQNNDYQFIITENRLNFLSVNEVQPLFHFLYYQLMFQLREIPVNCPFSQVKVPESISALGKEFYTIFMSVSNKEYIIDSHLYLNIVRDIQYFYKRNLITENELQTLKEYLRLAIKHTQSYMQMGFYDLPLKKNKFYLSGIDITSNTTYAIHKGKEESNFWLFSANPIHTTNKHICHIHKIWIDSLMRNSTLISGVNENILFEFISKQLDVVDNMDKIMY